MSLWYTVRIESQLRSKRTLSGLAPSGVLVSIGIAAQGRSVPVNSEVID